MTVLAIVSDIELVKTESSPVATGGKLDLFAPWDPDQWEFNPTAYRVARKIVSKE